jgi:hypothetical protein
LAQVAGAIFNGHDKRRAAVGDDTTIQEMQRVRNHGAANHVFNRYWVAIQSL